MTFNFKKIFKKNFISIFLVFLMVVGFVLRTYYLEQNNILFGYDQARDAYIASQITQGDLKILGPPVSVGGLYHGVLYYYFISLPYFLSKGDPILPIVFISILNILAIPFVYFIGKKFFDKKTAILSAIFYTISFDIIQYSNWLSNPSLAVPFSVVLFLGLLLFLFTKHKNIGIFLTALGYGLCFQSEFFLGYLIIPIFFSIYFLKKSINKKQLLIFIATTGLVISSMLISLIKFGPNSYSGLARLFNNDQFSPSEIDFSIDLKNFFVKLVENFYRTVFPFKSLFTFFLVTFCFLFYLKEYKKKTTLSHYLSVLWIFLFSQILILPFGGDNIPYINAGFQIPVILILSSFLIHLSSKNKKIFLALTISCFTFLLLTDFKINPQNQILNDIPHPMTIRNQLQVVDYTYQSSLGDHFSINTITNPFWINTLWSYLYQWYGQQKYNYLPSFHGRDQSGQLGFLPQTLPDTQNFYLIIEPDPGTYGSLFDASLVYEDSFSKVIETKNFNGIIVQKRQLTKPLNEIIFVK